MRDLDDELTTGNQEDIRNDTQTNVEELKKKAKLKALRLLERSDKTEKQLRDKLKEGEFPPSAIEEAIAYVKSYHYLDDTRYTSMYIRIHGGRKSRRQLQYELLQKGVSEELIAEAFSQSENQETDALIRLVQKRFGGQKEVSREAYQKGLAYFSRKGFPFDKIKKAMEESLTIV